MTVPNQQPSIKADYRVALIGEAPGADEVKEGKPFVGFAGQKLDSTLSYPTVGILRAACFVGNVMQIRPPTKNKKQLGPLDKWTKSDEGDKEEYRGPALEAGLRQLKEDLDKFNPTLCILMGKTALWAAKDKASIDDWRGSFFISEKEGPFKGRKCLATFHPSRTLHNYSDTPLFKMDLEKARREMKKEGYEPPHRDLLVNATFEHICSQLEAILNIKPAISCDIEGGIDSVSCIGFAVSPRIAFVVPFETLDRESVWSLEEESHLWGLVSQVLADPLIPKTFQNGLYDRFILQWSYNILTQGNKDDTMLKWWEWNPELEKNLGMQCSVLTDQPYYKGDIDSTDQLTFYRYCAMDAAVTYEINQKLEALLTLEQKGHYAFNVQCLNFLLYSELHGIRYDNAEAARRLGSIQTDIYRTQTELDSIAAGMGVISQLPFDDERSLLLASIQAICCHKRKQEVPKKAYEEEWPWVLSRLQDPTPLSPEERGRLAILTGTTLNMKSSAKFKDFLYKTCGLPTQYAKDPKTHEMRPTTNYEALLKLSKTHDHPALKAALLMTLLLTRAQMLAMPSTNGRIHCSYNLVGSETGRISSSKSMIWDGEDRVGGNLQTVPNDWDVFDEDHPLRAGMRDLYLADEDCYILKCDLKGADGWTIGAYCASIGDPTMLDDLKYGIKPAQNVAYILKFSHAEYLKVAKHRQDLKEALKSIGKCWEYDLCKAGIWGKFYTQSPQGFAAKIFVDSEGKINLTTKEARDFHAAIEVRYKSAPWHRATQRDIDTQRYPFTLKSSVGFTRRFFNRKEQILGEVLAHLPQVYTTYATKRALLNAWCDPANRTTDQADRSSSGWTGQVLRARPIHQVHDEAVFQIKRSDTDWAVGKVKQWFDNPIQIANQTVTIPYDGAVCTDWSASEKSKIQSL